MAFSRARIYKLLRYPSAKDVRSSPRPLHLSLASPWVHMPLGLSWLSCSAALVSQSPRRRHPADRPVTRSMPPHASCVVRTRDASQALTPQTGLHHDEQFCPVAAGRSVMASPALYRHGLLGHNGPRRCFRVAPIPDLDETGIGSNYGTTRLSCRFDTREADTMSLARRASRRRITP